MKHFTKITAALLAVIMAFSFAAVPAFAADADPYAALKEGTGYVALGDSFTRGYGAGDNWQNEIYLNDTYGNYECRNVGGSFPNVIADAFGLYAPADIRDTSAKFWPMCHDAVSVAYMLDLLGIDDGFRDEEFTYHYGYMTERYETDLRYFGDPASYAVDGQSTYGQRGEVMSVREIVDNASLITVQLGQADIIYKAQLFGFNSLDLGDIASLPGGIANLIDLITTYYTYWRGAYPLLLDYIKENNPDAKVVLVGTVNPIKNATATDDISIEIGWLINIIFDAMNTFTKECALKYGYMYVDISEVETPASANRMSIGHILGLTDDIEYGLIAHPTAKGYVQVGEKIVDAVKTDLEKDAVTADFEFIAFIKMFFKLVKLFFTNFFALQ